MTYGMTGGAGPALCGVPELLHAAETQTTIAAIGDLRIADHDKHDLATVQSRASNQNAAIRGGCSYPLLPVLLTTSSGLALAGPPDGDAPGLGSTTGDSQFWVTFFIRL